MFSSQFAWPQWVVPSWCHATDVPSPGSLIQMESREWREVRSVDGFGDAQQVGMTVEPQTGLRSLQNAVHEVEGFVGCVVRRLGLGHLGGMPAVVRVRAAVRVRQWLGESERRSGAVLGSDRAVWNVNPGTGGCPGEHLGQAGMQLVEFPFVDEALEHVEAATPIGLLDLGVQAAAVGRESDRPAVAEFPCAGCSGPEILVH